MIEKITPELFDWLLWRAGSPSDLGLVCLERYLIEMGYIIRRYAVGYCDGENLICRPKIDCKAVMFFKDDRHFWFHLTNKEFKEIFDGT